MAKKVKKKPAAPAQSANTKAQSVASPAKAETKAQSTAQAAAKPNKDKKTKDKSERDRDFLFSMSYATPLGKSNHWMQMLVIAFFGAFIIMITRMHNYQRPMSQFYWSGGTESLSDFFSFYKMVAIVVCAVIALLILLYRLCTQSLSIKRCFAYIPMIIYSIMTLVSYMASDYKDFAWLGYNDRFEGTLVLLSYMVMLFFIINTINSENNVKWAIYPIAVSSAILGLLGVTQAMDKDFFRTALGQKLIMPNGMVEMTDAFLSQGVGKALNDAGLIEQSQYSVYQLVSMAKSIDINFLNFTFQNREIYQTVYNINYVSFYLTLLLPLFGMIFIRSIMRGKDEPIWKKIVWGALFALLLFNLIGAQSSGGILGMFFVVVMAFIVFNKKIINWWKPVAMLLVITCIIGGITFDRWTSELGIAFKGLGNSTTVTDVVDPEGEAVAPTVEHKLHYIDTTGNDIIIGIDDNTLTITTYPDDPNSIKILDQDGKSIQLKATDVNPVLAFDDDRFSNCFLQPARDEAGNNYFIFTHDHQETNWAFCLTDNGVLYRNNLGALVDLDNVPHFGFENNPAWGSGRGYIFSRTFPMMKDTMFIGHGADTYCLYFPHNDYVGKLNSVTFAGNVNIIVDKPHNMYMGAWVGTGGVSVLALLAMFGIYLVQSIKLYFKNRFEADDFLSFAGVGIFLGIVGFLFAALVDDSTVSVMPMFYTLLGTGIAANTLLKKRDVEE